MRAINSAASLYLSIGGTAALIGQAVNEGLGRIKTVKAKPANNPAGSKLSRKLSRKNAGLTCHFGNSIPRKV